MKKFTIYIERVSAKCLIQLIDVITLQIIDLIGKLDESLPVFFTSLFKTLESLIQS